MKARKILNVCMVLTIVVAIVCSIIAVGMIKGWFDSNDEKEQLVVSNKTGIAMIERNGVAYEVTNDIMVKTKDHLYTKAASQLTLSKGQEAIVGMNSSSELVITHLEQSLEMEMLKGEAFLDGRTIDAMHIMMGNTIVKLDKGVVNVSVQPGSTMVYVYAGEAVLSDRLSETEMTIKSGVKVTIVDGAEEPEQSVLSAKDLNYWQIECLRRYDLDDNFCFNKKDLDKVLKDREQEKKTSETLQLEEDKSEDSVTEETLLEKEGEVEQKEQDQESKDKDQPEAESDVKPEDEEEQDDEEEQNTEPDCPSCTIQIVCSTILNNMGNLTPGKEGYIPSSGIILPTTEVEFSEGETVFDVLQRVCDKNGIQIEYAYTPIYESYYIEGINHIYEFDCGPESGWMYKVNGWFPNYGCSSYTLKNGDTIVWCYSCNGLGADVGGSNF